MIRQPSGNATPTRGAGGCSVPFCPEKRRLRCRRSRRPSRNPQAWFRIALMGRRFPETGAGLARLRCFPLCAKLAGSRRWPILYPPPHVRYSRGIAHLAAYCLLPITPAVLVVVCGMAGRCGLDPRQKIEFAAFKVRCAVAFSGLATVRKRSIIRTVRPSRRREPWSNQTLDW